MAPGKFKVKFVDGKPCIEKNAPNEPAKKLDGKVERKNNSVVFVPTNVDQEFDRCFEKIVAKVCEMRLTKQATNEIFTLCGELISESLNLFGRFCEKDNKENAIEILAKAKEYASDRIASVKTTYLREKKLKKHKNYVAPITKSMGLKWNTSIDTDSDLPNHKLIQTTFQFVPPSDTLGKLFANTDFKAMFLEYNDQRHDGVCVDGVYKDFCCGNVSKSSEFFRSNDTIVLQFGYDEFDVCCGLKSKATIHKVFAIYFRIRNMPKKFASRLNNIFLVALCNSSNFKETGCSDDNIITEIVRDLKQLEDTGVDIGDNKRSKVAVFDAPGDNLGINVLFGFAGGFNATYFCRLCRSSKADTQLMTCEDDSTVRSVASYDEQISKLEVNSQLDMKETEGVKKNCLLNNLKSFHVCKNVSVDIMHDILEGVIPYFLKSFFKHCIDKKICDETNSVRRVRDFNYGKLNSKNKPSKLRIGSENLGQNATQYHCIMIHLPFIYFDKKRELFDVWPIMESLLNIMRISFSYEIHETDLQFLAQNINEHLSGMIRVFGITLKPKHHNLVHYARVIREMGPVRYSSMMRYESKHKFFTDTAKKINNFRNICKTLAETHQAHICSQTDSFCDVVEPSKKKCDVKKSTQFETYRFFFDQFPEFIGSTTFHFLKINGILFRKGFLIVYEQKIAEIVYVLNSNHSLGFSLLCHFYDIVRYDSSLSSVEIKKTQLCSENLKIIDVNNLSFVFEKKNCNRSIFVIMENLEMYKSIQ